MRSFAHVISDPLGLHARSCITIAREAAKWSSTVIVRLADVEADGKSTASLLALHARGNDTLTVSCEGPDESEAASTLEALMRMSL